MEPGDQQRPAITSHEKPQYLSSCCVEASEDARSHDRPRTKHLDGLRGLAALFVFLHHITPNLTLGAHEYGFGQDGHWHFTSFPFIRLIWSGGNAAVPIFFVISGFVLSIGPLTKSRDGKGNAAEERRYLLEAILRRPIRLYGPPLAITLLQVLLLQVPRLVVLDPGIPPFPKDNLIDELDFFVANLGYYNPFGSHEGVIFPYNQVIWTLPIELRGSLLIYGLLCLLSLGLSYAPSVEIGAALAMVLLFGGVTMLEVTASWSMVCFIWGASLAVAEVWPVEQYLHEALQRLWCRRGSAKATSLLPFTKISPTTGSGRPGQVARTRKTSFVAYACLTVGLYLLSEPGFPDHRWYSENTPGWQLLSSSIPAAFDDTRFFRYWTTIGALLVVYALLRIKTIQSFFTSRILQFLGRISFSLYLVHLPWTHIFADRIKSAMGGYTAPALQGTLWDQTFVISDAGPPGLSPRFLVMMFVVLPSTLLIAWVATIMIDEPSVRLSKWVSKKLRIRQSL